MNAIHLVSGRGPTGAAAAAMSDVKALLAAGGRAWIASRSGGAVEEACAAEGLPFAGGLKLGRGAMRLLSLPRDVRRLREIFREHSIAAVHAHRSDDQLLAAAAVGRDGSVRLFRTWHRDPGSIPRVLLSKLAAQPHGCVSVAREHAETLRVAGARRSVFIHAAVDTLLFRPSAEGTGAGGTAAIAQVGRWKRERDGSDRGQLAALDIFQRLPRELPWKGLLVGRGEMGGELRREAYTVRRLPEERVELVDFAKQSAENFARLLSTFGLGLVFVPGGDGTSRAAAEMLACGVPLAVADVAGLREFAEDPACALRLPPRDPDGWASALAKLLSDPPRLAEMRSAARRRAEQVHALRARGEALAEFYRGG